MLLNRIFHILLLSFLLVLTACGGEKKAEKAEPIVHSEFQREELSSTWYGYLDEEVPVSLELELVEGHARGGLLFEKTQTRYNCQGSLSPYGHLSLRFYDSRGLLKAQLIAYMRSMFEIEGEYLPADGLQPLYLFVHQKADEKILGPGDSEEEVYPGLERWRHRIVFDGTGISILLEYPQVKGKERFNRQLRMKFLRDQDLSNVLPRQKVLHSYQLIHQRKGIFSFREEKSINGGYSELKGACNFFVDGDRAWAMELEDQFNSVDKIAEMIQESSGQTDDYPWAFFIEENNIFFILGIPGEGVLRLEKYSYEDLYPHLHPASPLRSFSQPET